MWTSEQYGSRLLLIWQDRESASTATMTLPDAGGLHAGPDKAHIIGGISASLRTITKSTETRTLTRTGTTTKAGYGRRGNALGGMVRRDCTNDSGRRADPACSERGDQASLCIGERFVVAGDVFFHLLHFAGFEEFHRSRGRSTYCASLSLAIRRVRLCGQVGNCRGEAAFGQ